jgi:thiamine-phosphate diphosphorylase
MSWSKVQAWQGFGRSHGLAESLSVYAVTDSRWLAGRELADVVEQAIQGGATFVQLREKECTHERRCELAREVLAVCRAHGVPFVVNDDVECAREVGADGVHVGQSDMACARARQILGPDAIVGVSADNPEQALAAWRDGADYLGCAVYATPTKGNAEHVGLRGLARVVGATPLPVVAIGGINQANADSFGPAGAAGIAVVSAIFAADDPREAASQLAHAVQSWHHIN